MDKLTTILVIILVAAFAIPVPVHPVAAQPAGKVPLIGYLSASTAERDKSLLRADEVIE